MDCTAGIGEGARTPAPVVDEVPEVMRRRVVSLRAFDGRREIVGADLAEGDRTAPAIEALVDDPRVAYRQSHHAKFGGFAARVDRA